MIHVNANNVKAIPIKVNLSRSLASSKEDGKNTLGIHFIVLSTMMKPLKRSISMVFIIKLFKVR